MYLGHRSGFTKFNPENVTANSTIPIPYITEIETKKYSKENNVENLHGLELKYNEADITFNYTAIEFNYPEKLTFSYLLEGYDNAWSDYSFQRSKSYTNLPHGNYAFKVTAKNSRGIGSKIIGQFRFKVLPAFWQTIWFKICSFICLVGFIYYFSRRRIANIRKKKKKKPLSTK